MHRHLIHLHLSLLHLQLLLLLHAHLLLLLHLHLLLLIHLHLASPEGATHGHHAPDLLGPRPSSRGLPGALTAGADLPGSHLTRRRASRCRCRSCTTTAFGWRTNASLSC